MGFLHGSAGQGAAPQGGNLEKSFDKTFGAPLIPKIGGTPLEGANVQPPVNALQQILTGGEAPAPVVDAPNPHGTGHGFLGSRHSLLDILGGISDVVATEGGAHPLYQSGLDAATARDRAGVENDWEQKFNTQKLTEGGQKIDANGMELNQARNVALGQTVNGLSAVFAKAEKTTPGSGAAAVGRVFPMIAQQLNMPDDQKAHLAAALASDPQGTLEALTHTLEPKERPASPSSDRQMYDLLKEENPALAEKFLKNKVDGAPLTMKDRLSLGIQLRGLGIKQDAVNQRREAAGAAGGGSAGLTPEALDYAARGYMSDGKLPPLGQGKAAAAMRAAIVSRAATLAGGIGGDAVNDPAAFHANFKANADGLKKLAVVSNQILASERTANANGDQVLATMGKGAGTTGIPLFNAWQNRARNKLAGNPDVVRFNTAVGTFADEYARVVTGGAASGSPTTVHAQQVAESRINGAQTPDQLRSVVQQMRVEMANRRKGFVDQGAELRASMRLPASRRRAPAVAPPAGWSKAKVIG